MDDVVEQLVNARIIDKMNIKFYVCDTRTLEAQGPFDIDEAKKLCGKLNDEYQSKLTKAEKKTKPRQRDQRPYTFGTKSQYASFGKDIKVK